MRFLGSLDAVAALAGAFQMNGALETAPADDLEAMLRANLAPAQAIARATLPHLLKQGGSLVFVGSRMAEAGGAAASAVARSQAYAARRPLPVEILILSALLRARSAPRRPR